MQKFCWTNWSYVIGNFQETIAYQNLNSTWKDWLNYDLKIAPFICEFYANKIMHYLRLGTP